MCTGSPPFRTAAAATYCIFVSKQLPQFPEHMSSEAHFFLAQCLEESAKSRASSVELLSQSFLLDQLDQQSMDKSTNFKAQYMSSNVTINPLSDFKSLTSDLRDDRSNTSFKHNSRGLGDSADCSNSGFSSTSFLLSSHP
jgi:serine/threonine protein kinase